MPNQTNYFLDLLRIFNILIIVVSVVVCSILMLLRLPGMELLEVTPNWLLIWVVTWSVKRTIWQAASAGIALGWICDGLSLNSPSHIFSLVLVGVLTSSLKKQKYIGEDFISVAFIVFFMVILAETVYAIQYGLNQIRPLAEVWQEYPKIALISAIISSLWSPAIYYPLERWFTKVRQIEKTQN